MNRNDAQVAQGSPLTVRQPQRGRVLDRKELERIRRVAITALFADELLLQQLVLKGGNALALLYDIGDRTSLDLDLSMEADFSDTADAEARLRRSLEARFNVVGYDVFDWKFGPRPPSPDERGPRWGGYEVTFKLILQERQRGLHSELEAMRRDAQVVGPDELRTFTIQISKFEYCAGKGEKTLDGYTVYVYSPEMLVVEKIRALCQQLPGYRYNRHPHPRARDFYDIDTVMKQFPAIDLASLRVHDLMRQIFAAKEVPLVLLGKLADTREFHRQDWPRVIQSVGGGSAGVLQSFDWYFDALIERLHLLEPLWKEESPLGAVGPIADVVG